MCTPSKPAVCAFSAPRLNSAMTRGISSRSSARGVTYSFSGRTSETKPLGRTALGASGGAPSRHKGWVLRPTCQSCSTMRPPRLMHGAGDLLPAFGLRVRPDARGGGIAPAHRRAGSGLGNDQPGAGALAVLDYL